MTKKEKKIFTELLKAAQNLDGKPKADHIIIQEQTINNICEFHNITRDEALLIIKKITNGDDN